MHDATKQREFIKIKSIESHVCEFYNGVKMS